MKSIEERAKEASPFMADQVWYIQGATEQRVIDDTERDTAVYNLLMLKLNAEKQLWIEKACEWIKSNLDSDEGGEIELCFRKAMEE